MDRFLIEWYFFLIVAFLSLFRRIISLDFYLLPGKFHLNWCFFVELYFLTLGKVLLSLGPESKALQGNVTSNLNLKTTLVVYTKKEKFHFLERVS